MLTPEAARSIVADDDASQQFLAQIAQEHPDLRELVRSHPNAYGELVTWIDSQREDSTTVSTEATASDAGPIGNSGTDRAHEARVRAMLIEGEELVTITSSEQRFISVTSARIILHERSGGYSVVRNDQIIAIEVSDDTRSGGKFLKIHFGAGLSRMVSAANDSEATAIVSALARG